MYHLVVPNKTITKHYFVQYWKISSVEYILARLTVESSITVQKLITKLIHNSFCPENLSPEERLQRGIVLIEKNFEAARKFYHCLGEFLPSVEFAGTVRYFFVCIVFLQLCKVSVEYILLMLRCVYSCVKQSKSLNGTSSPHHTDNDTSSMNEQENINEESIDNNHLTVENRAVICGLLECGAILWRSIGLKLQLVPTWIDSIHSIHKILYIINFL